MNILVVGGAGYIGSVVTNELLKTGNNVVVYDSLVKGHRAAVPAAAIFVKGDLADREHLNETIKEHEIEAALHFAAFIEAGESMKDPGLFFRNNVANTINLLDALIANDVPKVVFSSTAAVYGAPDRMPITEDFPLTPINTYGQTKLMVEQMLHWYNVVHGLRYAALRYFNAAGAAGERGEDHHPESHLIPIALQVALGQREHISIFGTDYDTPDGTCIRDYIHILDLASAHLLALQALEDRDHVIYNLGNGKGFSVREVIEAARRVTGHPIPAIESPRRPGDMAVLIAGSQKIQRELGWKPRYPDLDTIVAHAWEWRSVHPNGYDDQ